MRIFLLGATPSFDLAKHVSAEDRLAATGHNTGNQIIAYGLLKSLEHSHVEWDYTKGPTYVDENFDAIVIAAANFLFPSFDLGGMAEFIANTRLPVLMVGLGAQAQNADDVNIPLQPGTKRLMDIVAERTKLIGVRGEFTARVLERMGITNVQIVGCPSYYMNGPKGFNIRDVGFNFHSKIAVHASRDVVRHSFSPEAMGRTVVKLYSEAARRGGIFVAQTEREEIALAEGDANTTTAQSLNHILQNLGASGISEDWLSRSMRVFWEVEQWIQTMEAYPLVIGTRFHGTMAALHSGSPAICITHDSRTSEMCNFLSIPSLDLEAYCSMTLESLRARYDFDNLRSRYVELYPEYLEFLKDNGFEAANASL